MRADAALRSPTLPTRRDLDVEPLRLETGEAAGDGLEPLADGIEMVQSLLETEIGERLFERAAVLEIGRDPGRPEAVIANLGADPGCGRAPADHGIGIRLRQYGARQLAGAAADRAEQRPLGAAAPPGAVNSVPTPS
jgi:hypothetical protein